MRTQQRVLGVLFGQPDRSFYASELIRMAGTGSGAAQRELARLEDSGLIVSRRVGHQKHYQANAVSAHGVVQSLDRRKLSHAEAAVALGVSLAGIKALRGYKLGAFSIGRLMGLLTALGDDAQIVVRRSPRSRRTGTISVAVVEGERVAFDQARRRALKRLGKGLDLQWSPSTARDDVHQR